MTRSETSSSYVSYGGEDIARDKVSGIALTVVKRSTNMVGRGDEYVDSGVVGANYCKFSAVGFDMGGRVKLPFPAENIPKRDVSHVDPDLNSASVYGLNLQVPAGGTASFAPSAAACAGDFAVWGASMISVEQFTGVATLSNGAVAYFAGTFG